MNREIKFRAWDIRHAKMVPDALKTSEIGQLVTVNAEYFNNPFSFFDGCKWLQYTGLKDKHGKEIYDGDILSSYSDKKWVVKEVQGVWCVVGDFPNPVFKNENAVPLYYWNKDIEVLGNIYEHPELLTNDVVA